MNGPQYIAFKGEVFTCPNGHEIYRAKRDMLRTDTINSADFEPIGDAPQPSPQMKVPPCPICGEEWLRHTNEGYQAIVAGERRGTGNYKERK